MFSVDKALFIAHPSGDGDLLVKLALGGVAALCFVLFKVAQLLRRGDQGPVSLVPAAAASSAIRGDADFEATVAGIVGMSTAFYQTVAGPSHKNVDGTSRVAAIKACRPLDAIEMCPEPTNSFDSNAMALRTITGRQIGYLNARTAREVADDFRKYGPCWLAFFCHADRHPSSGRVVGAVIYLVRLPVERITEGAWV
jgi:hypothetical protein